LKSVFCVVNVPEHSAANAEDHWTVAVYERGEGCLVSVLNEQP
jgi:hypothetical protein